MMAALLSLKPVQRYLRIPRLLREVRGQRALLAERGLEERMRRAAELRLVTAMTDLIDEMNELDAGGVLDAVAECFATIFGGPTAAGKTGTKAP